MITKITMMATTSFGNCVFCGSPNCILRCSLCKAPYCDAMCQKIDWQNHRTTFCAKFTHIGSLRLDVTQDGLNVFHAHNIGINVQMEHAARWPSIHVGEKFEPIWTNDSEHVGIRSALEPNWYMRYRSAFDYVYTGTWTDTTGTTYNEDYKDMGPLLKIVLVFVAFLHNSAYNARVKISPNDDEDVEMEALGPKREIMTRGLPPDEGIRGKFMTRSGSGAVPPSTRQKTEIIGDSTGLHDLNACEGRLPDCLRALGEDIAASTENMRTLNGKVTSAIIDTYKSLLRLNPNVPRVDPPHRPFSDPNDYYLPRVTDQTDSMFKDILWHLRDPGIYSSRKTPKVMTKEGEVTILKWMTSMLTARETESLYNTNTTLFLHTLFEEIMKRLDLGDCVDLATQIESEKIFQQALLVGIDYCRICQGATTMGTIFRERVLQAIDNLLPKVIDVEPPPAMPTKDLPSFEQILRNIRTNVAHNVTTATPMIETLIQLAGLGVNLITGMHPIEGLEILEKCRRSAESSFLETDPENPVLKLVTQIYEWANIAATQANPLYRPKDPVKAVKMFKFMKSVGKFERAGLVANPIEDWKPKNILSIDGGGLKGISVLKILLKIFSARDTNRLSDINGEWISPTETIECLERRNGVTVQHFHRRNITQSCETRTDTFKLDETKIFDDPMHTGPNDSHHSVWSATSLDGGTTYMDDDIQNKLAECGDRTHGVHYHPKESHGVGCNTRVDTYYPLEVLPGISKLAPYQVFDLVCGTSTGSLIAFWIACKRASLEAMLIKYFFLGAQIFPPIPWYKQEIAILMAKGRIYSANPLEIQLATLCGEDALFSKKYAFNDMSRDSNARIPRFFCTSSAVATVSPPQYWIFTNYETKSFVRELEYKDPMWQTLSGVISKSIVATSCIQAKTALRCSTAAPMYLPPKHIDKSIWTKQCDEFATSHGIICNLDVAAAYENHVFIDGGVGNNNPTFLGFLELMKRSDERISANDIGLILSVGTGYYESHGYIKEWSGIIKESKQDVLTGTGALTLMNELIGGGVAPIVSDVNIGVMSMDFVQQQYPLMIMERLCAKFTTDHPMEKAAEMPNTAADADKFVANPDPMNPTPFAKRVEKIQARLSADNLDAWIDVTEPEPRSQVTGAQSVPMDT